MGTKISAQTEKTSADGTEELPINDSGAGKRIGLDTIRNDYIANGLMPNMLPYFTDANFYLGPLGLPNTTGTGTLTAMLANYDLLIPIAVPYTRTFTKIACVVTTGSAGNVRLGIYNANQESGQPTTNLVDTGNIDTTSTGVKSATISQSLTGGLLYYLAANFSATPTVSSLLLPPFHGVYLDTGGKPQHGGLIKARTYAAFIDQTAVTFSVNPAVNQPMPLIGIR